jgi:hypothetical protein
MQMPEKDSLNIRKGVSESPDPAIAAEELHRQISQQGMSWGIFYCSSDYDLDVLGRELKQRFGDVDLIGCTTAGEITPQGYLDGSLTGVSIACDDFRVVSRHIKDLSDFEMAAGEQVSRSLVAEMEGQGEQPTGQNSFGFLLIDGLSMREEAVVGTLYKGLGGIQLVGGSAGDGLRFDKTFVYYHGEFHSDSAILTLIQTSLPFSVFKTEHFESASEKMVVTEADPSRRIVTEINGESAGHEYARILGMEVNELTPMIFSSHPVVVHLGGKIYVRSIQKVNADGSLTFFCAIDEGIVLTVARGLDLVQNLRQAFNDVKAQIGSPQIVFGCDCILRNLELDEKRLKRKVSKIMADNNVIGFATYGEQFNAMHVNQTFTAAAIGLGSHEGGSGALSGCRYG